MHHSLRVSIPKHVCVNQDATNLLIDALSEHVVKDIVIVYTGNQTKRYVKRIEKKLKKAQSSGCRSNVQSYLIQSASSEEAQKLDSYCSEFLESPILLGVGGGSCIDVVKLVASRRRLILMIYPTVLSSDCLTSPISVLQDGVQKTRVSSTIPNGIFIDTNVTAKAPKELIMSGIADLMSNESALLEHVDMKRPRFQGALAQGLILSGLSMNFAGSSVTASGSEHLISHALDYFGYGCATHGQQVYIGMLCCDLFRAHFKRETASNRVMKALKSFGLNDVVVDYGISKQQLVEAIIMAPTLRPERKTILNQIENLTSTQISDIISPLFDVEKDRESVLSKLS